MLKIRIILADHSAVYKFSVWFHGDNYQVVQFTLTINAVVSPTLVYRVRTEWTGSRVHGPWLGIEVINPVFENYLNPNSFPIETENKRSNIKESRSSSLNGKNSPSNNNHNTQQWPTPSQARNSLFSVCLHIPSLSTMATTENSFQAMAGSLPWFKNPFRKIKTTTPSLRSALRIGEPS